MTVESKHGKGLYRNGLSYFAGLVMVGSAGMILFLLLLEFSLKAPSPYLGIFTYLALPMVFGAGVVLMLYGMRRESLRRRRLDTKEARPYPMLDLNDQKTRKWFGYILVGGSLLGILLTFVGYNGFLFTESVTFCGKVCHTVMEPEYKAYLVSPHARVACVECHVGSGANWYVKSKLSGLRQILAVTFNTYERPIPVPIKNLRPARETCEQCHWPDKFYGAQLVQHPYFRYDKANTAEQVSLLVKTGGGSRRLGDNAEDAGIHWHVIQGNEVSFKAVDKKFQDIPWVRFRGRDGRETVYRDRKSKVSDAVLAGLPEHVMDCMDCHNRPSHKFTPPDIAVDKAMAAGLISPGLPWIKKVAVDALTTGYMDKEAAGRGISDQLAVFYNDRYPKVYRNRVKEINKAVGALKAIYDRNVFPAMNVNWKTYASNIGHLNWPGCFRCHDGRHETKAGKVLSHKCTLCHTMPQRGPLTGLAKEMPRSNKNWHPWKLKGKHAQMRCDRCHQVGYRPPMECASCHKMDKEAPMMTDLACGDCHLKDQEVLPVQDCTACHDDLRGLHSKDGHKDAKCTDCHVPHTWWPVPRKPCLGCHDKLKGHDGRDGPCIKCHSFKKPPSEK